MKTIRFLLGLLAVITASSLQAQVINTATMDTTTFNYKGKISVEGYIDAYYAFDFNQPADGNRTYFVSMSRHNEISINLAYIDVKYSSSRLRARFVPGFGSYINANYAAEPGSLKNIVEASAGIKLWPKRNIWVDVGVFGSPYTNESAISKDHLAYTRSFAPEYVPYYLSGVKLTAPLSSKVNAYLYFLNGWQQIQDVNKGKSIGTQIEYRPNNFWLLNWDTYVGSETSAVRPEFGMRYFSDVYFIYTKGRWSATGCVYAGLQERNALSDGVWWQANLIGRFNLTEKLSLTGRVEYFDDPDQIQITSVTGANGFSTASSSLGANIKLADNILVRFEGRTFFAAENQYQREGVDVKNSNLLVSNVTIWF
jgi:hypothetical protein